MAMDLEFGNVIGMPLRPDYRVREWPMSSGVIAVESPR